ncbi:MAG TPA: ATP-binding protein [Terracidiphilus sp.]
MQSRKDESEGIERQRAERDAQLPDSPSVHFYEDESIFLDKLAEFVGASLGGGCASIVVATASHRIGLVERLERVGINVAFATGCERLIALDAEETLSRFMVRDRPDRELFFSAMEPILLRARAAMGHNTGSITVFGEMVVLLWDQGKHGAAIELERIWNDIARRHALTLRCVYPLRCFANEAQYTLFQRVCNERVLPAPAEGETLLADQAERLRMVSSLEQKELLVRAVVDEREEQIAQRKEVEEKLRRIEEFARNVVENSDDCVKRLDLHGHVEYISPPGMRAFELEDSRDILGRRWVEFWKEEDRPKAEAALGTAQEGGVGSFQGECSTSRGTRKSWDVRITPVRNAGGKIESLIAVARDITELRRVQQMAVQAEKLAAAGRMAATIAHEINNPLEAVTNFIYLARTTPGLPEDVTRHLEIADRELSRVAQIAQKTLGFYRDTSKNRWVDVCEVIQDVMLIYERKLRYKQIRASASVHPGLKVYIKQGEIKQALANLIANAIDASTTGGKIWIRARSSRHWRSGMRTGVRITLADNGAGMPPEIQRRIFVPFFTTKADVGTGIGLWVTRSIIEQYGGYLRFRSRQGAQPGTAMSFFVPDDYQESAQVALSA